MKISLYNLFFHPFHTTHSSPKKALSLVSIVALSVFTGGSFLIVFGAVHLRERIKPSKDKSKDSKVNKIFDDHVNKTTDKEKSEKKASNLNKDTSSHKSAEVHQTSSTKNNALSPKAALVKKDHAKQLEKFKNWAAKKDWIRFRPQFSHYDWWSFPVDKWSSGYQDTYQLNSQEIEELKKDKEFMDNYHLTVELVVRSWGYDLKNEIVDHSTNDQRWTGYGVRLGKMADSLFLFGEKDLYKKLQGFYEKVCKPKLKEYPLENWIIQNLSKKFE